MQMYRICHSTLLMIKYCTAYITQYISHGFFHHYVFSLMENKVPHFLGFGHLMRPVTELSTSRRAAHHHTLAAISPPK